MCNVYQLFNGVGEHILIQILMCVHKKFYVEGEYPVAYWLIGELINQNYYAIILYYNGNGKQNISSTYVIRETGECEGTIVQKLIVLPYRDPRYHKKVRLNYLVRAFAWRGEHGGLRFSEEWQF